MTIDDLRRESMANFDARIVALRDMLARPEATYPVPQIVEAVSAVENAATQILAVNRAEAIAAQISHTPDAKC